MKTLESLMILNATKNLLHDDQRSSTLHDVHSRRHNILKLKAALCAYLEAEQGDSWPRIAETGIDLHFAIISILHHYRVPEEVKDEQINK